jgi:NADPH:quinone reductase-like Zn-dependent oxidoreductase
MEHMQAVVVRAFGGPEVLTLETLPVPHCGPNEVLVRVHAAGVGPWDAWVIGGSSAVPQPLPLVPGSDVSGVVEQVGEEVHGFVPGDAVYGATNARFTNGYAQLAPCDAAMMARKPVSLTHVEAASVPVIATTAWQMLFEHAGLHEGQRVLIQGAAGNVGRYAVQFAVSAGLDVQVTPSGRESAWMAGRGVRQLPTLSEPKRDFDAAIDLVGGDTQRQLFGWIKEGGSLVSAVAEPDRAVAATQHVNARFILVHVNTGELEMIAGLFDRGAIKPWVGETLPLADARAAHEMLAGIREHTPGKIVLLP